MHANKIYDFFGLKMQKKKFLFRRFLLVTFICSQTICLFQKASTKAFRQDSLHLQEGLFVTEESSLQHPFGCPLFVVTYEEHGTFRLRTLLLKWSAILAIIRGIDDGKIKSPVLYQHKLLRKNTQLKTDLRL